MGRRAHVLLFPFPTLGHINPMGLLAAHLVSSGEIDVTLILTARTVSLSPAIAAELSSSAHGISVEILQDSSSDSSQDESICSSSSSSMMSPSPDLLVSSMPRLRLELEELLRRLSDAHGSRALEQQRHHRSFSAFSSFFPCCIISDGFLSWTQDVADRFGIPRMVFWASPVTTYAMGFYAPRLISTGQLPLKQNEPADADQGGTYLGPLPGIGACRLSDFFYDLVVHEPTSGLFRLVQGGCTRGEEAQRVIVNSVPSWESKVVEALRAEGLPIDPIGPLLLPMNRRASLIREDSESLRWLDEQMPDSVVYVSFGSNARFSADEIEELVQGLDDSNHPFLLVLRTDLLSGDDASRRCSSPPRFLERIDGRRCRVTPWAPQLQILAHCSVGAFVSHCGWNSALESIWHGKPIVGCPRAAEQSTNLKLLLDLHVAIPLDPAKNRVELKRNLVADAIRTLMHTTEGEVVRKSMLELSEEARHAMQSGASRSSLNRLVDDIKEMSSDGRPSFLAPRV